MQTKMLESTDISIQLEKITQERDLLKADVDRLMAELNNVQQPWVTYEPHLIKKSAEQSGLQLAQEPLTGLWSGINDTWVGAQDLIVLEKIDEPASTNVKRSTVKDQTL